MNAFLSNFSKDLNVAVIGASGGIGRAFIELLSAEENVKTVHAFSRSSFDGIHEKIVTHSIDITNEQSVIDAAAQIEGQTLDIIIVACGVLHGDDLTPEKSLRDLDIEQFRRIFDVNTFGPALVAKHFLPLIPRNRKSVFAALSARVGSIEDNRLGGWYAYRASKAALNMLIKNSAIETARRFKQACIIGLHPGTVNTTLSKPFQYNIKEGKLFTPQYSAECLLKVINDISPIQSGQIFAWDGQRIPY